MLVYVAAIRFGGGVKSQSIHIMISHIFPPHVLEHVINLDPTDPTDPIGDLTSISVSPSETFGHALARAGIKPDEVASVQVNGPLWYEPDWEVATR